MKANKIYYFNYILPIYLSIYLIYNIWEIHLKKILTIFTNLLSDHSRSIFLICFIFF